MTCGDANNHQHTQGVRGRIDAGRGREASFLPGQASAEGRPACRLASCLPAQPTAQPMPTVSLSAATDRPMPRNRTGVGSALGSTAADLNTLSASTAAWS